MTNRYPLIPCLLSITHSPGRRDGAGGRTTRRGAGIRGNRAMISRLLSTGLAAAMVVGLAAGAWAQAGNPPGSRRRKPEPAPTARDKATAESDQAAASQPEPASDPAVGSGTKDAFDEAEAKLKGGEDQTGVSPGD